MKIKSKGYKMDLTREEANTLFKITGKFTGNMAKEMELTDTEKMHLRQLYDMMKRYFNEEQT